jgi:hypothetical protein
MVASERRGRGSCTIVDATTSHHPKEKEQRFLAWEDIGNV